MKTRHHKKAALRRAVLIGLALSATMWTTGMAETININRDYGEEYNKPGETITISGGADTAIKQTESQEGSLAITSQGNTISSDDKVAIQINGKPADDKDYTLKIDAGTGKNTITSGANDGISSNNGNTVLSLAGAGNEINAAKDGIVVSGSGARSNITVDADGEAGNIITAGANGLTVSGGGNFVSLKAENGNTIFAGQDGITVEEGGYALIEAEGGVNYIDAGNTGIRVEGLGSIADVSGETHITAKAEETGNVFGIDMNGGKVILNPQSGADMTVEASTANGNATGIHLSTEKKYGEAMPLPGTTKLLPTLSPLCRRQPLHSTSNDYLFSAANISWIVLYVRCRYSS